MPCAAHLNRAPGRVRSGTIFRSVRCVAPRPQRGVPPPRTRRAEGASLATPGNVSLPTRGIEPTVGKRNTNSKYRCRTPDLQAASSFAQAPSRRVRRTRIIQHAPSNRDSNIERADTGFQSYLGPLPGVASDAPSVRWVISGRCTCTRRSGTDAPYQRNGSPAVPAVRDGRALPSFRRPRSGTPYLHGRKKYYNLTPTSSK
jgi:hypothetical protein